MTKEGLIVLSITDNELAEPQGTPDEPGQGETPEPTEATQEPAPEQENYLLHYRTAEEAEKALREKDSHIGKLQSELGELRGSVEQIQQAQQQYFSPADEESFEDLLDENPELAVQEALQRGDRIRLDRALESWYEVAPRKAGQFERALERQQLEQNWQQQYQPIQQEIGNQQLVSAYQSVKAQHPDFDQMEPAMSKAAELAPHLLEPLSQGTAESKQRVIESLYYMAKGMQGQQAQGAPQELPQGAQVPQVPHPQGQPVPYVTQGQTVPPLGGGPQSVGDQADQAFDRIIDDARRRNERYANNR